MESIFVTPQIIPPAVWGFLFPTPLTYWMRSPKQCFQGLCGWALVAKELKEKLQSVVSQHMRTFYPGEADMWRPKIPMLLSNLLALLFLNETKDRTKVMCNNKGWLLWCPKHYLLLSHSVFHRAIMQSPLNLCDVIFLTCKSKPGDVDYRATYGCAFQESHDVNCIRFVISGEEKH